MKITINEVLLTKFRGSTIKLLSHHSNQLLKISNQHVYPISFSSAWMFFDSFSASLHHPVSSHSPGYFLTSNTSPRVVIICSKLPGCDSEWRGVSSVYLLWSYQPVTQKPQPPLQLLLLICCCFFLPLAMVPITGLRWLLAKHCNFNKSNYFIWKLMPLAVSLWTVLVCLI